MSNPIMKYINAEFRSDCRPFKDRGEVKAEIRECDRFAAITQNGCFLFVIVGVVGDALNIKLGLEPMIWLLLAIVAGLNAIIGHMRVVAGRHLLGIESENKEK